MTKTINASLFFLAAGIFTSVTILGAYQILFAIPLAYYLFSAIKCNEFEIPKSAWFLIAFTAVAILSLVLNFDVIPKPSKNFGRLKYFIYGFGGIFVFRAWFQTATPKAKKIILNTFFVSIVLASIYAMYNFSVSDRGRAKGLTDTMRYGYGSAMVLLTLLSGILNHRKMPSWFNWKLASVVFVFGFIGMYLTYTRGALLGFLCGLPFVFYYYRPKLGIILGSISVLAVLGLVVIYLFGSGQYNSRFLVSKNNGSDNIRRSQWKAALIATQEKPILGWGLSNFHSQLKRIKNDYDLDAKHYNDAHSHNLFLEVSSGTGLIGLLVFLGWLVAWAMESFKGREMVRKMVIPLGVCFVISSQFEVTFDANNASMIFFVYAISSAINTRMKPS